MAKSNFYEVTLNNGETETVTSGAMCINGQFLVFYNETTGREDLVVLYPASEVKKVKKLNLDKGDNSESTEQDN